MWSERGKAEVLRDLARVEAMVVALQSKIRSGKWSPDQVVRRTGTIMNRLEFAQIDAAWEAASLV